MLLIICCWTLAAFGPSMFPLRPSIHVGVWEARSQPRVLRPGLDLLLNGLCGLAGPIIPTGSFSWVWHRRQTVDVNMETRER